MWTAGESASTNVKIIARISAGSRMKKAHVWSIGLIRLFASTGFLCEIRFQENREWRSVACSGSEGGGGLDRLSRLCGGGKRRRSARVALVSLS